MILQCCSLNEYVSRVGEETALRVFSQFTVGKDSDLQRWFRESAIAYEKSDNARTFLFITEDLEIVAFFSLALSILKIPPDCPRSLRDKITGYGRKQHEYVPCFLLGQFARDDEYSNSCISGREMLCFVVERINAARDFVGGRFLMAECSKHMISYYEGLGFRNIENPGENGDLFKMILLL